jgi:hypothetical protein
MTLKPHMVGQTIYWLNAQHTSAGHLAASSTVHKVDYDLMHHRFGHPSKDIFRQASSNIPSGISYPKNDPVCKRCAKGKMPAQAFLSQIVKQPNPLRKFI